MKTVEDYYTEEVLEYIFTAVDKPEWRIWKVQDVNGTFRQNDKKINSVARLKELIGTNASKVYVSVSKFLNPQRVYGKHPKKSQWVIADSLFLGSDLLFDLDSKNLEMAHEDGKKIIRWMRSQPGYELRNIRYSVTGETPVLVSLNDKIKLTRIDECIRLFKQGEPIRILSYKRELSHGVGFFPVYDSIEHYDKLFELYYAKSKTPIKITEHHSVYKWDSGNIVETQTKYLKKGDYLISFKSAEIPLTIPTIRYTYSYHQKMIEKEILITKDLLKLIGYYLSEGHNEHKRGVLTGTIGFSFHDKEKYIDECRELIIKLFGSKPREHKPSENSRQISFNNKGFAIFLDKFFGCGAGQKHLADFVWRLPKEYMLELLQGYINGDGSKNDKYRITIKSKSRKLIMEWVWLLKLHGINCAIYHEQDKKHKLPQGTLFKGSFVYILETNRSDLYPTMTTKFAASSKEDLIPIDGLKKVYYQCNPRRSSNDYTQCLNTLLRSKKSLNHQYIQRIIQWLEQEKRNEFSKESEEIIDRYKQIDPSLCFLAIRQIINTNTVKKVYDVSVDGAENFFGGEYPVLLHNSGTKGFHLLYREIEEPWIANPLKRLQAAEARRMELVRELPKLETIDEHHKKIICDQFRVHAALYSVKNTSGCMVKEIPLRDFVMLSTPTLAGRYVVREVRPLEPMIMDGNPILTSKPGKEGSSLTSYPYSYQFIDNTVRGTKGMYITVLKFGYHRPVRKLIAKIQERYGLSRFYGFKYQCQMIYLNFKLVDFERLRKIMIYAKPDNISSFLYYGHSWIPISDTVDANGKVVCHKPQLIQSLPSKLGNDDYHSLPHAKLIGAQYRKMCGAAQNRICTATVSQA